MPSTTSAHTAEGSRQQLYDLMNDETLSLDRKQERALAVGCKVLAVENGHIQRVRDDGRTHEITVSAGDAPELIPEGAVVDRATTYCRRTLREDSPIALSDAPNQGWADDPAYAEHGFDCYLGTTLFVDGDTYGTVCFVSRGARPEEFSPSERMFVELLARLLGREIEANEYEQRIDRKERAKRRSEDKYEALLQLAPDAIFLADADTAEIAEANEKAVELTGYARSELRGTSVLDLHPPEDRGRYARLFDGGFEASPRDRFDDGTPLYLRRADGSNVPIEMSVSTVTVGGRELVQGIVRDVSARRERERELERTKEFLQQTQEAVSLGGWEVDLDSDTLRWTDEVYRIYDLPLDYDPTVADALDFFHPEDQPAIEDSFEQLVNGGDPYDLELRIVTATDTIRWVRVIGRPQYDGDGDEITAVRGVFQDITERKERERDLRLRSQAIEESTIGITIADASHEDLPIIYVNDGFTKLTGYPKERVLGENCRFLQGDGTDEETIAEIREAIEANEPVRTQILNYRANGTPFWNKLSIAPVTGEDGSEVTHYVGIQEDITAQKRRDRLIEVLNRVLRHNLRNDMNKVEGFISLIADRTDGDIARMARRAEETAAGLTELSERAQEFQTAVRDSEPLGPRDLVEDVRTVVADLRAEYPDTEFRVDAGECETVMATERLRLALRELGENAAKHGQSPSVTYRIETTTDGRVTVHVRDTGPGFPTPEREVLETGQETPLVHGSGLGLWLVNWIVTGLGGDVTATVDEGTTVTIRFPSAADGAVLEHRDGAFGTHRA